MGTFIIYLLKVALCQALFWLAYRLLLSRDTYHSFNRFVLCAMQVLAFSLPLVHTTAAPLPLRQSFTAATVVIMQQARALPATVERLTTVQVLFLIYIVGVLLLAGDSLLSLSRIWRLTQSGQRTREQDGLTVTQLNGNISPFSWFGHVVIGQTDNEDDRHAILLHEAAHVRLHHSFDAMAVDMLTLLTWFNPFAWLMRRALNQVHEYEADDAVLRQGIASTHYQMLLIRKTVGDHLFSIANHFHTNSLKKRIKMMNTHQTTTWHRAKAIAILPLALIAVTVFASPRLAAVSAKTENAAQATVSDTLPRLAAAQAQVPPTYSKGEVGLLSDISKTLVYPPSLKTDGIVIVEFEIRADGSVGHAEIKKSLSADCDRAVLAAISKLGRFTPAKQDGKAVASRFTLPISFRKK